jgi:predicted DNA-binding antitoxin AbrB/MazE fold protein
MQYYAGGKIMPITVEAIYESGILRPLTPLPELEDKSRVRVTIEPASKSVPKVRRSPHGAIDLSREREWVLANREKYRGQWVVLDGDRLVGHTTDPEGVKVIFDQARAEGVRIPFVKLIPGLGDVG